MLNPPIDLHDEQTWDGGPQCHIQITLREKLDSTQVYGALDALGIEGVYANIELFRKIGEVRYRGHWRLSQKRVVGALISMDHPVVKSPHLFLRIPPIHMATVFGSFPWLGEGWRFSRDTLRFHAAVLTRMRRLLSIASVKAIMISDEVMCRILRGRESGLFVLPEIAEHFGWPVRETRACLAEVDLEVLKR